MVDYQARKPFDYLCDMMISFFFFFDGKYDDIIHTYDWY